MPCQQAVLLLEKTLRLEPDTVDLPQETQPWEPQHLWLLLSEVRGSAVTRSFS